MKIDTMIPHIRSASREIVRQLGLLDNRYSSIGSVSQCHALVELDIHGVMNLGQLTTALNLEKSTTSRLVMQLLEKKICQVQLDKNDRRNKLISLTKKGVTLVTKIHLESKLQVQQALENMNEEDRNSVVRGLSVYAKALKRSRSQSEYTIRPLIKKDIPQLINLTKIVWAEFGFNSNHPAAPLFERELKNTYEIYNAKRSKYFVLAQGEKIVCGVGFTPLLNADEGTCEAKGMYLSEELRGLGLGLLLSRKLLDEAKNAGFKKCYIETMSDMRDANALYKKLGFTLIDKPLGNTGHNWTDCWYIKEI